MIPRFRSPFTLVWEITDSCNLACLHCRSACDGIKSVRRNRLVEARVLDYVVRERVFVVNLSGGEPLLHPDILDLTSHLSGRGVQVGVSTNGFLWSRLGEGLVQAGLEYVQVSLDGPESVHNRIRGNRHAFTVALSALESARRMGIRAQMNTVLSALVVPHLEEMYELARDLGVALHVRRFIPTGTGERNQQLIPGPEEHMKLLQRLVGLWRRGEVNMDIEAPLAALVLRPDERPAMGCGAGTTQIGISMDGDVYPCIFLRAALGNLLKRDLDDIWRGSRLLQNIRDRDTVACSQCSLADACGGCRACAPTPYQDDPLCPRAARLQ